MNVRSLSQARPVAAVVGEQALQSGGGQPAGGARRRRGPSARACRPDAGCPARAAARTPRRRSCPPGAPGRCRVRRACPRMWSARYPNGSLPVDTLGGAAVARHVGNDDAEAARPGCRCCGSSSTRPMRPARRRAAEPRPGRCPPRRRRSSLPSTRTVRSVMVLLVIALPSVFVTT